MIDSDSEGCNLLPCSGLFSYVKKKSIRIRQELCQDGYYILGVSRLKAVSPLAHAVRSCFTVSMH
jgi:hypothetical protein